MSEKTKRLLKEYEDDLYVRYGETTVRVISATYGLSSTGSEPKRRAPGSDDEGASRTRGASRQGRRRKPYSIGYQQTESPP
jgi:hypothetical protein